MARCEFSDLSEESCAHCTGRTGEPEPGHVEIAYWFLAVYPGRCDYCDRSFDAGDQLARTTTDHDLICARCATPA